MCAVLEGAKRIVNAVMRTILYTAILYKALASGW
jgi:hypothetical protein